MNHDTTVFVGLDVHKDSITATYVGADPSEPPVDLGTFGTQQYAIDKLSKKVSGRGVLQFTYEAGPCGFWLEHYLRSKGQHCLVAAPSLIPKRPGERIKTDRRDARNLALALRAGTLSAVHVPTADQEAFRDVVRVWQQSKRDITGAKQRLKAFLLRNDIRYSGRATWNAAHRRWLSELVMSSASQQIVYQELLGSIDERERRRDRLEQQLETLAPYWDGYPLAQALLAFRGIQKTVAYTVVAETADLSRFSHPSRFMAWLGLVPSEDSRRHSATGPYHALRQPLGKNSPRRGRLGLPLQCQGERHHQAARGEHRSGHPRPRLEGSAAPLAQVPTAHRSRQAQERCRHRRRTRARSLHLGRCSNARAPRVRINLRR